MEKIKDLKSDIIIPDIDLTLRDFLLFQKRFPVIAITGPAGVGKSTITNIVASYLGAKIYTELPENNPFLKIIKETSGKVNDVTLWMNNQNYFLATDIGEITKAFIDSKNSPIVFDFALTQTFIFSDIKLTGNYLRAFNQMYETQFDTLPKPDIVIEVSASDSTIISRLESRGKHIDEFVVKMVEKLNGYYKGGIVEEKFSGGDTKIIQFDNTKQFADKSEISQSVLNTLRGLI